jgi:hypothetical protein
MRDKRGQAFWMTAVFYVLAGPLVGLLSFIAISFLTDAWDVATNRLAILIADAQMASCASPYSEHFDLRCFQRGPDPRQFLSGTVQWQFLPWLIFGAYVVGCIPAFVSGLFIGGRRFLRGRVGFGHASLVGALVGLMTGLVVIAKPDNAILLFFICLISTVVCWLVTERWWRATDIADTDAAERARS